MEKIVIYRNRFNDLLQKYHFAIGFSTIQETDISKLFVDYWFHKNTVIVAKSFGEVIKEVYCANDGSEVSLMYTTYKYFFEDMKKLLHKDFPEAPSIWYVFSDVLYDVDDTGTAKYSAVRKNIVNFSGQFRNLFQEELPKDHTGLASMPKQFQFYKHITSGDMCYVGSILHSDIVLCPVKSVIGATGPISIETLSMHYEKIDTPEFLKDLLMDALNAFNEITNTNSLLNTLEYLDYGKVSYLRNVISPINDPYVDFEGLMEYHGGISFCREGYKLTVNTTLKPGRVSLCRSDALDPRYTRDCKSYESIKEFVKPCDFLKLSVTFISDILADFNYLLDSMPDVKAHLYDLLTALSTVPEMEISPTAKWEDFADTSFNPVQYFKDAYGLDVNVLPRASVRQCKTKEACDELYVDIKKALKL